MSDTDVTFATNFGNITVELYDSVAPQTVQNFLSYVNSSTGYNSGESFFHRLIGGFVLQGGGYDVQGGNIYQLPTNAPVANEYNAADPNVIGTIAMATVSGDPNSATDQFFFNLANNSSALGPSSSNPDGYTVFGQVIAGMTALSEIAALPTIDANSTFQNLPIENGDTANATVNDLVYFTVSVGDDNEGGMTVPAGRTVTETSATTYTGHTQVLGTLKLTGSGSVADSKNVALKASGAVFDISGVGAAESVGNLSGVAGSAVDLGADTLTVNQVTAATLAGVIADGGASGGTGGTLVVQGTAPLTLTAAESYTGKTQVYGLLDLSGGGALGSSKAVVLKAAGAVFDISGVTRSESIRNLAGVAGSTIDLGSHALKVNQTTTATYAGVISDGGVAGGAGGSLIVKGTADLKLTGHNGFTGGVTLLGGALELGASNAAGTGHITFSGAAHLLIDTAALSGDAPSQSLTNPIDGFASNDTLDLTGLQYVNGSSGAALIGGDLIVTNGSSSVTLHLNGITIGQGFTVTSDPNGGSDVTETGTAQTSATMALAQMHHALDLYGV